MRPSVRSFWLDKCFMDCPAGYHSVRKQGCLDLCEPNVPPAGSYPAQVQRHPSRGSVSLL